MEKESWIRQIEQTVQEQKEDINRRDYNFFLVGRFLKIAERTGMFSATCASCEKSRHEIEDISGRLAGFINDGPGKRKELENRTEALFQHLKKEHGILPDKYYTSFFSFVGLATGSIIGLISGWLLKWNMGIAFLTGWAAGLIIGRVYGLYRDRVLKKLDRQL